MARKVLGKKKNYKRKTKIPRSLKQNTLAIKRSVPTIFLRNTGTGIFTISGGGGNMPFQQTTAFATSGGPPNCYNVPWILQFTLADISNAAAYCAMFDKFRLHKVDVKIEYGSNQSNVASLGVMPTIAYAPDYDDSAYPVTESALLATSGSKRKMLSRCKWSLHPRTASNVYGLGTPASNFVQTPKNSWYDTGYPNQVFYGVKGFFMDLLATAAYFTQIRIDLDYHLEFKDIIA